MFDLECDVGLRFIKFVGVVWVSEIEEMGWFSERYFIYICKYM